MLDAGENMRVGTVLDIQSFSFLNISSIYSLYRNRHMYVILPFPSTKTQSNDVFAAHAFGPSLSKKP